MVFDGDDPAAMGRVANGGAAMTTGLANVDALLGTGDIRINPGDIPGTPATVSFSFMDDQPAYSWSVSGFEPFNASMQASVREALGQWASVTNLSFVEVSDDGLGGMMRFGSYADDFYYGDSFAAYAYYPTSDPYGAGSDVWVNNGFSYNTDPAPGNHGFLTQLHEIGHTLGLKHPGNYNGTEEGPFLSAADDTRLNTVMSYNGPTVSSLGPLDIQAIQWLYGVPGGGTVGNMTSGTEGSDSIAAYSTGGYVHGNGGNDTLSGSAGNDGMTGGANEDWLMGAGGNDTLYGHDGFDNLYGGLGADLLNGNQGTDWVYGEDGADTVRGGKDSDYVYGNAGNDACMGDNLNDLVYGGSGDDILYGGKNEDYLFGEAGNDTLLGDLGSDTVSGGSGADVFVLRNDGGDDQVTDFSFADGDKVGVSGSWWTESTTDGIRFVGDGGGTLLLRGIDSIGYDSITYWW